MTSPSDVLDAIARARVDSVQQRAFDQPALVATLTSSEELHAFADDFNWDDASVAALFEVVRHPLCDAGTAKLIYFRAAPDDLFAEASTRDEVEDDVRREHWDLLLEIEGAVAEGRFATARIAFEPPWEGDDPEDVEGRPIPAVMFEPIRPGAG